MNVMTDMLRFWKLTTVLSKPRVIEVEVSPPPMQKKAPQEFMFGADAKPPGAEVAAPPAPGKARHIWLANHASDRDVTQSPSNLG